MNFFKNLSFLLLRILVKRSGAMPLKSLMRPNNTKTTALVPVKSILVIYVILLSTVHSPESRKLSKKHFVSEKKIEDNLASPLQIVCGNLSNKIQFPFILWELRRECYSVVTTMFSVRLSQPPVITGLTLHSALVTGPQHSLPANW